MIFPGNISAHSCQSVRSHRDRDFTQMGAVERLAFTRAQTHPVIFASSA